MEGSFNNKCKKCNKKIKEGGGIMGPGEKGIVCTALCEKCLKTIFPEGKNMPVTIDKDGNLYFIDEPRNVMIIFFSYGDTPYASCTEISLEEEECGCAFPFFS